MTGRSKRRRIIGGALVALVAAAGLAIVYWGQRRPAPPPDPGYLATAALVAGFDRALAAATAVSEPFHCAELAVGQAPPRVLSFGKRKLTHDGFEVVATPVAKDRTLVLGVVADARGDEPATLAQLAEVHRQFARARVELVLSLGGMGRTRDPLIASLGALVDPSWAVIAIPGDREDLREHEAAVAILGQRGAAIIDGVRARLVLFDGVSIATLPGLAGALHLVAGADGCRHTEVDAITAAALLSARPAPRVWASYAPPRQRGVEASDLTLDGINVGEPELTRAVTDAAPSLVLSAQVDDAAIADLTGALAVPATAPRFVAAGAIEALPVDAPEPLRQTGSALIVTLSPTQIRWRRIVLGNSAKLRR